MNAKLPEQSDYESTVSSQTFLLVLLAVACGTLLAAVVLPGMVPNLAASLLGADAKAFWYLSRGSAFVALSLLWLSMALGLGLTNKLARIWPGAPAAFAIHEYVSLLGLAFTLFHALILLGDRYIQFSVTQILIPFSTTGFKPLLVGLGQVGFYVWLLLALSFYVRPKIGAKAWRALHYLSFLSYCVALYHGIASGTDTQLPWAQNYYWISGVSLLFLLMQRIVVTLAAKFSQPAPRPMPAVPARSALETSPVGEPQ